MRGPLARPLFRFHPHTWTLWLMATPLLMGAALFFDFFPRQGPPRFDLGEATGSGEVFNLGWPVVTAAYVPNGGFQFGPLAGPVFAVQGLLYLAGTAAVWVWQRATLRSSQPMPEKPVHRKPRQPLKMN